jgi:protocatechuate 3,4-dioxygenase beta subunit
VLKLPLVVLLLAQGAALPPRDAPTSPDVPPRTVSGVVRSAQDRIPLRHARIVVIGQDLSPSVLFTDDRGAFVAALRQDTTYTLNVAKPGYAPAGLQVTPSARDASIEVTLARGAAINGEAVGLFGEPFVRREVVLERVGAPAPGTSARRTTTTDDRGAFRFGGLPAGEYEITLGPGAMKVATSSSNATDVYVLFAFEQDKPPRARTIVTAGEDRFVELRDGSDATGSISTLETFVLGKSESIIRVARGGALDTAEETTRNIGTSRGRGTIEGRVFDIGNHPVIGAAVRAVPAAGGGERTTSTDTNGRYRLEVASGRHLVSASAPGFLAWSHGQQHPRQPGRELVVRSGGVLGNVDISVPRATAIEGTVTDALGEPIEGLTVQLLASRPAGGRRALVLVPEATTRTDDRGHYRLHGIDPGRYFLRASDDTNAPEPRLSVAPGELVFHPGRELASEAFPLEARAGADILGANIIFAPGATARVTGTVVTFDGRPFEGTVSLSGSMRSGTPVLESRTTGTTDGVFEFTGVPPGDYVVQAVANAKVFEAALLPGGQARINRSDGDVLFGTDFVTVHSGDGRVAPTSLVARPGITMRGRIRLEGDRSRLRPSDVRIEAISAELDHTPRGDAPRPRVEVAGDWTVTVTNVLGPIRLVLTNRPPGWWLASATIDGIDAGNEPIAVDLASSAERDIEIVLSSGASIVSGAVLDDRRGPAANSTIVAFSTTIDRWYEGSAFVAFARADSAGRFTLPALAPDEYWIAAVDQPVENDEWELPDAFLNLVARATRIHVRHDEEREISLRATRWAP